jgi:hypothetical protein
LEKVWPLCPGKFLAHTHTQSGLLISYRYRRKNRNDSIFFARFVLERERTISETSLSRVRTRQTPLDIHGHSWRGRPALCERVISFTSPSVPSVPAARFVVCGRRLFVEVRGYFS